MMKAFVLALVYLLAPYLAISECVVYGPPFKSSSERISVTTLLDGNPVKGAQVSLFPYPRHFDDQPQYSVVSDVAGVAVIPRLSTGSYEVVATAQWGWAADLLITVSESLEGSRFPLELRPDRSHAVIDAAIVAAAKLPPTRLPAFAGSVRDPSGAGIKGAAIAVWRAGESHTALPAESTTGDGGRFSISLPEGKYVALFSEPGFSLKSLVFEISHSAPQSGLDEILEIGHGCVMDIYRD